MARASRTFAGAKCEQAGGTMTASTLKLDGSVVDEAIEVSCGATVG